MAFDIKWFESWGPIEDRIKSKQRISPHELAERLRTQGDAVPEAVRLYIADILEGRRAKGRPREGAGDRVLRQLFDPVTWAVWDVARYIRIVGRRRGRKRGIVPEALEWAAKKHGIDEDEIEQRRRRSKKLRI